MEKLRKRFKQNGHKFRPELPVQLHRPNLMDVPRKREIKYGRIRGIDPGATFINRQDCAKAGVHAVVFPGIHAANTGAYSVCLSGGYEDDQDDGETLVYTGTGGQEDSFSGNHKQVKNQTFKNKSNASLKMSFLLNKPVRVVRGPNPRSKWAPSRNYRYDGLYLVEKAYYGEGISGHRVCRFLFRRLSGQPQLPLNPAYTGDNGV